MTVDKKHLVVKRSTIPGSGKGLFTKQMISKGTRIVEYKGRVTSWKDVKYTENAYIYYVNRNHVIDAERNKKALARYANDARGSKKMKGVTNNSKFVKDGLRVFIESTKPIPPGSEIFVGYGKEYWDVDWY